MFLSLSGEILGIENEFWTFCKVHSQEMTILPFTDLGEPVVMTDGSVGEVSENLGCLQLLPSLLRLVARALTYHMHIYLLIYLFS
jgi:hypothetical protein